MVRKHLSFPYFINPSRVPNYRYNIFDRSRSSCVTAAVTVGRTSGTRRRQDEQQNTWPRGRVPEPTELRDENMCRRDRRRRRRRSDANNSTTPPSHPPVTATVVFRARPPPRVVRPSVSRENRGRRRRLLPRAPADDINTPSPAFRDPPSSGFLFAFVMYNNNIKTQHKTPPRAQKPRLAYPYMNLPHAPPPPRPVNRVPRISILYVPYRERYRYLVLQDRYMCRDYDVRTT